MHDLREKGIHSLLVASKKGCSYFLFQGMYWKEFNRKHAHLFSSCPFQSLGKTKNLRILVLFVCLFETGYHGANSPSSCLNFPCAKITGIHHHAWQNSCFQ
jgi:hypothetical protein